MFLSRTLANGHSCFTTCVDTLYDSHNIIVSGAERGELCLWSATDGTLLKNLKLKKRDDVSGIVCSKLKPELFYVSAYRQVFSFDVRFLNKPLAKLAYAGDCINQVVLDSTETMLAFAEDSGEVELFDLNEKCFTKVLEEHTNICNTVAFRPNFPGELFSGGMDNLLLHWNIENEEVTNNIDMSEIGAYKEDLDGMVSSYVVSPPFLHTLSTTSTGHILACGTENALIHLFDTSTCEPRIVKSIRRHNKGVSQVHFPKFSDELLFSASNDFRLCMWKVNKHTETSGDVESNEEEKPNKEYKPRTTSSSKSLLDTPCVEIVRNEKINWIASGQVASDRYLVVVDGTKAPSIYSFSE